LDQCDFETRTVERFFKQNGMSSINTTNFSIEEIATRIMADADIARRIV
jgi:regulator of PEP synthase PpsR (kinase-PPPase family)